jgi:hypothetical protein
MGSRGRINPTWTFNIALLKANSARVMAHCERCTYSIEVDLAKVEREKGELFSFWNRRPRCPVRSDGGKRCEGRLTFSGQIGGAWPHMMREEGYGPYERAHEAWRADIAVRRDADRLWRYLRKRQLHRRKVRAAAAKLLLLPRDARLEAVQDMMSCPPDELAFHAEVRIEVLRRLAREAGVDLVEDFEAPASVIYGAGYEKAPPRREPGGAEVDREETPSARAALDD